MKATLSITLVLLILTVAVIASLAVFETITTEQAMEMGGKAVAAIAILGVASLAIGWLSRQGNKNP
ncbi:MAG: hypothetical protein EP312_09690 [Gammaproteobacteria bacterium]|nr:MAG: hypothetical protein EP312_09690 [Gammaproteobacteria bacterium]